MEPDWDRIRKEKEGNINRSVALKAAVELYARNREWTVELVLAAAAAFEGYLERKK